MRSSSASPRRNISKIRKVYRSRPGEKKVVKSFFLSTKMAPIESITDIVLLSFLTDTAPQNVYLI